MSRGAYHKKAKKNSIIILGELAETNTYQMVRLQLQLFNEF